MIKKVAWIMTMIFVSVLVGYAHPSSANRSADDSDPGRVKEKEKFKAGMSAYQLYPESVIQQTMNYWPAAIGGSWEGLPFSLADVQKYVAPPKMDWRELGGVTAIDIQPENGCGGCWVYAATAVFESLIKIKTGREVDLSEEQISSCMPNGNHTGIAWQAFNFMQLNGVTTEDHIPCDYSFPVCNYPQNSDFYYLHDNWILGMWDAPLAQRVQVMKYAIQHFGPVAGGFVVYSDWGDYNSGVYIYDGVSPLVGHHSIEIVGWADDPSVPQGGYWIIKNDLGRDWGENGFFRIAFGQCEIDMAFMFAKWDPDTSDPIFALKVGTRYYEAGTPIALRIFARVPEGYTPFYQASGLPTGAAYDPASGLFTWTPADSQIGVYEITFTAAYDTFETSQCGTIIIIPRR